ncbi:hypothetical protein LCGC14_1144560 [marine sediment metagenome]|uniref:Uncharacterized protein n=1 Tax=marine sediment metagenome TaxID=412755 RepID=A0A0F9PFH9_9ZZZZ
MKIWLGRYRLIEISNIWVAIICIALLEVVALLKGINGNMLRIVIAAIAGLAGLATKRPKVLRNG